MSYVGIDFDTHAVHLVKLEETGDATYTRCELIGEGAFERTREVRQAMPSSSFWDDVVACAIEEPQGIQKATVAKLKAVQGAIVACLPRSLLVEPMEPARWRAAVGLPGNASKGHVKTWVLGDFLRRHATRDGDEWSADGARTTYPAWINDWPQDACDAYCLALAVSRLVETEAA